jgi:nucleoid-associated protein YgaU
MAPTLRSTARLGLWTAALVAVLRLLAATGGGPLSVPVNSPRELRAWVADTSPPDMTVALLRLGALALTGYLLAVTVLAVAARLLRLRGLAAAVEGMTPTMVHRLVSAGSGIGLVLGAVAGALPAVDPGPAPGGSTVAANAPAADRASATMSRLPVSSATMTRLTTGPGVPAPEPGEPAPEAGAARGAGPPTAGVGPVAGLAAPRAEPGTAPSAGSAEATMTRIGDVPPPTATMTRVHPEAPARPPPPGAVPAVHDQTGPSPARPAAGRPAPGLPRIDPTRWVVEPGDSLWSIAEEIMRRPDGSRAGERAVARYWRRLITANRHDLVDRANPDLLVPGQQLVVPPPDG